MNNVKFATELCYNLIKHSILYFLRRNGDMFLLLNTPGQKSRRKQYFVCTVYLATFSYIFVIYSTKSCFLFFWSYPIFCSAYFIQRYHAILYIFFFSSFSKQTVLIFYAIWVNFVFFTFCLHVIFLPFNRDSWVSKILCLPYCTDIKLLFFCHNAFLKISTETAISFCFTSDSSRRRP